jgi:hypothetical protein
MLWKIKQPPAVPAPNEGAVSVSEWRHAIQMSPGAPSPCVFSTEFELAVAYGTNLHREFAVVRFLGLEQFTFGYPNDEALAPHPLYGAGLRHYAFWEVTNSPVIAALSKANREAFAASSPFATSRHWVATFKDSTLEVIAETAEFVGVFRTATAAEALAAQFKLAASHE